MLLVFLYSLLFKLQAPEPALMEKPAEVKTRKLALEKHEDLESCELSLETPEEVESCQLTLEKFEEVESCKLSLATEVGWSPFRKVTYM